MNDLIAVSVLFSEPKIPQSCAAGCSCTTIWGFSALQRAENSSMVARNRDACLRLGFSALQRAENSSIPGCCRLTTARSGFSALQRAENSSMTKRSFAVNFCDVFQCSSASRKFLN